jgi:beta-lactamase class A
MRRLPAPVLLLIGLALLGAEPAAAAAAKPAPATWQAGVREAREWAATRQGLISFAVRTPAGVAGVDMDRTFVSASVVKAMLLVAYLRQRPVRARPLRRDERALLSPMIRASDNTAATRVRDVVGNAGLARLAHRVGMTRFATAPTWGATRISARDQTRFFLRIDSFVPARHRDYAMELLRTVIGPQRWGIARAVPRDWTIWFKGGWGAGTGAVDHQSGLLRLDGDRVAIAVLTLANPSHAYGRATEEGIARRLLRGLDGRLGGEWIPRLNDFQLGSAQPSNE